VNAAFDGFVSQMQIKLASRNQTGGTLSGGNQQKIVLAKWLERNAEVIIFDEPTRGIDVGAKYEIYLLINRLAAQGKAVLMISSELPEVLAWRPHLVMHEGQLRADQRRVATQEQIMELAVQ
jgi:ABC-type sugar transport system ATPase subunit